MPPQKCCCGCLDLKQVGVQGEPGSYNLLRGSLGTCSVITAAMPNGSLPASTAMQALLSILHNPGLLMHHGSNSTSIAHSRNPRMSQAANTSVDLHCHDKNSCCSSCGAPWSIATGMFFWNWHHSDVPVVKLKSKVAVTLPMIPKPPPPPSPPLQY